MQNASAVKERCETDGEERGGRYTRDCGVVMPRYIHRYKTPITVVVEGAVEHWYYAPYYDPRKLPVIKPVEWCLPDSPAQRWLEAHGYREVEYRSGFIRAKLRDGLRW
jgi:hypothetical protein